MTIQQREQRRFAIAAVLGALCFAALTVRNSMDHSTLVDASTGVLLALANVTGVAIGVRRFSAHPVVAGLLLASSGLALAATLAFWTPILLGEGMALGAPSPADVGWMVGGQCLATALLFGVMRRETALLVVLDVAAIMAAVALVVGVLIVAPSFADGAAPIERRITQVVRTGLDLVILAAAVRALLSPRPRPFALTLLAFSGIGIVVSDFAWNALTLSGTYVPGGWADLGWFACPILMTLAVLHPSIRTVGRGKQPEQDGQLTATGPLLLGGATLVLPAMIAVNAFAGIGPDLGHGGSPVALVTGGTAIGAVVATRVLLLLRKSQRLAADLRIALTDQTANLQRTEARYEGLVEQLPACLYVLQLHGGGTPPTPLFVSSKVTYVTGLPYDDWMGGRLSEYADRDDLRRVSRHLKDAYGTPGSQPPVEFRLTGPDGVRRWLRDPGAVVSVEDGICVMRGVLFDVSEAREAEEQRAKMEMELNLSQKLDAVGQLAAGIAHEINTPIQFVGDTVRFLDEAFGDYQQLVCAYEDLVAEAQAGAPSQETLDRVAQEREIADLDYLTERVPLALQRATDGIGRVATIVRAMRDFAHPGTVDKKPIDLNEALRNTLVVATNEYKYVADVETDFGELPQVLCSGGDVNQVFLNLLVNAAHAIASVAESREERGRITVRTRADGDDVVVSIGDTGCGIPQDVANRVYDPFFTTKAVGQGTGQGLAIARTIVVERHNGSITFETEPGAGTTFYLRFPVNEPARAPQEQLAA